MCCLEVPQLRKPKSEKVLRRVLGRVLEKGGLLGTVLGGRFYEEKEGNGTVPSSPLGSPLFPGTLPNTFSDLGSPVAGGPDLNPKLEKDEGATGIGATGLRGSEREICL